MYINQTFEISMVLDAAKFHKVFDKACDRTECMERSGDEYIDHSLEPKGITIIFRDSQYKKKVRVLVNLGAGRGISDSDKFVRKLDKRIREYFGFKYKLEDFNLSGMAVTVDIHAGDSNTVSEYLKVLQRIGKVKNFSPVSYDCFGSNSSFCLTGNSNGIEFLIYDLEELLLNQLRQTSIKRKKLKSVAEGAEGVLRAEVRLAKPKAIRAYAKATEISEQIIELAEKNKEIFMDAFTRIVPFGDFYKKDRAVELIRKQVDDSIMRRKMLQLLTLIPEKKSMYLAQKAMKCRNIEKVMDAFAKINLSPVTISKRHEVKHLRSLYSYFLEKY